jgi:tetratricopeptide (TPR) repeat protein
MSSINLPSVIRFCSLAVLLAMAGSMTVLQADPLQEGAAAFGQRDYAAAARAYETAIASSGPSAGLYYNLAMAQMKDGKRPEAALNLHRAIMLDPRMVDARVSLSEIERSQGVPLVSAGWRGKVAEKVSLPALFVTGSVLAWLGAFLLLYTVFKKGRKFLPALASIFLLVLGGALFAAGVLSDPRIESRSAAVILADGGATLLAAPADQSATVTRLPAGASLRILQRSGEWTYCETLKGEKGWTPSQALQPVVPAV